MHGLASETVSAAAAASEPWRRPRPRVTKPRFCDVIFSNGRGYVRRSDLDRYKAELLAFALGVAPVAPPPIVPDPFVPLKQVCAELGVGRRTIGRRILESQAARA